MIILPYLGVLVYLIARGHKMREHAHRGRRRHRTPRTRQYIQSVAGSGGASTADEISRLADLKAKGVITDEEFATAKAKALSGS